MNTRLLLPPVKAATVQFPPSCPVVFFRSSAECATNSCDTGKSSCAGNGGDDEREGIFNPNIKKHGTAVGLGIVRSVYIDLSPESGRQLFYAVEILTNRNRGKHNKDMPPADSTSSTSALSSGVEDASASTSHAPETFVLPEWSIRYAPNCPALFDLTCVDNEDDDHDAQDRPSTIVSNEVAGTTTASVAKGIILCGLPTLSEDDDGVTFVYSALINHTDGDQFYEVHDIPLHAIRFDPSSVHREVPSTEKASSSSTTINTTTTSITTSTNDDHATSSSFVCEESNLEDPTDAIDATSSHKDKKDKEPKVIGSDIEHTFNDPMTIQPNTNDRSSKESSSPISTSSRSRTKSGRRDRDGTPSPSKKSRSKRSSEKKERRKKEKDRRERSSSPRRSSHRDRRSRSRSRSRSRDRLSHSTRSRKHSHGRRSSRSRSLDHERGRRSSSYDRYERWGRSPSRSRSYDREDRRYSRPSSLEREISRDRPPSSSGSRVSSTYLPDSRPSMKAASRRVRIPEWIDPNSVVQALDPGARTLTDGSTSIRIRDFSQCGILVSSVDSQGWRYIVIEADHAKSDISRAHFVVEKKLCELVKNDGAYCRLLYDLAEFDAIEKSGHCDGGPILVVDPLSDGASSQYSDHQRPWRMILEIPYSQRDGSFHITFLMGENGSRVFELQRQFGCLINVFHQHGRHTSDMCRPYISIKSAQKQNVTRAAEEIRAIIRQHQTNCDCSLRL